MDEARLDEIKRAGRSRRSRRYQRNAAFATLALVAVLGVGTVAVTANPDEPPPQAARGSNASSPVETPPQAARSSNASGPCVESTDAGCGPLRWVPQPAPNQKLIADVTLRPASVAVGAPVRGVVEWSDPDAPLADLVSVCWGDSPCAPVPPSPCAGQQAFGRWSPPPRRGGEGRFVLRPHRYETSGRFLVSVTVRSMSWPTNICPEAAIDPYGEVRTVRAEVVVR
jgi:hypothetical protein